jgi:hypothetical protein
MKTFQNYLQEAETKTKNKSKVNINPNLDAPVDQPVANRTPDPTPPGETPAPELNKANKASTQRASQGLTTPRMADLLSRMRDIEPDADDEWAGFDEPETDTALSTEVNTDNLPAQADRALTADGVERPEWHKVSNLPGNMQRAIRTLGRQLFRSMTTTPTDDIWMIANLGGQGPNSSLEVNAVANWIRNHGRDLGPGDIDFDTSIPGYLADIRQYTAGGIRWLLVRDEFGNYIYSWPENTSVGHTNAPELGQDQSNTPRLTNR